MKISTRCSTIITIIATVFIGGMNMFLFKAYLETAYSVDQHQNGIAENKVNTSTTSTGSTTDSYTNDYNNEEYYSSETSSLSASVLKNRKKEQHQANSLAMAIVNQSFQATFASLVDTCKKQKDIDILDCFSNIYDLIKDPYYHHDDESDDEKNNVTADLLNKKKKQQSIDYAQHWWFQTMIRDVASMDNVKRQGVHGPWHIGQAINPNITMCMIEKIGIKQWHDLFQNLNGRGRSVDERKHSILRSDETQVVKLPMYNKEEDDEEKYPFYYPSIVFLRDPLDRFLSAYIDKCVSGHRKGERHCEPNDIFNIHGNNDDNDDFNPMLSGLSFNDDKYDKYNNYHNGQMKKNEHNKDKQENQRKQEQKQVKRKNGHDKKAMFAAYVDTMPLKWNLHFYPQSFYCNGLYRFIDHYDFIGKMDSTFYIQLDELGKKYGGRFEKELQNTFHYASTVRRSSSSNTFVATSNAGVETKASDKVKQYYTPRSLRQVLQYVAIDYIMLNLTIPDWAEDMLREGEEI